MATIQTEPLIALILQGQQNPDSSQHNYRHDIDGGSDVTVTVKAGKVAMVTETNLVTGVTAKPAPAPPVTAPAPPVAAAAPTVASMSDGPWYLTTYPDVAAAKMDPLAHYAQYGWKEGRNPGPKFNTMKYLAAYPTVTGNALLDYVNLGYAAGRQAFPVLPGDPLKRPDPVITPPVVTPPVTTLPAGTGTIVIPPPVVVPAPMPANAPPPPISSAGPRRPPLSGLEFIQKYPVGPESKFNAIIGYVRPIGGVMPFSTWILDHGDKYQTPGGAGLVAIVGVIGTTDDVITLQCTDGRGDQVTAKFLVKKTAPGATGLALNTPNPSYACSPLVRGAVRTDIAPTFQPVANGPAHGDVRQDVIGVWVQGSAKMVNGALTGTPHPLFTSGGGLIYCRVPPTAGEYPVTITASNPSGDVQFLDETLKLLPIPPVNYIEFTQRRALSTATSVGDILGYVAADTPTDGAPVYDLVDPTGTLYLDNYSRAISVVKPPAQPGPLNFTIHLVIDSGLGAGSVDFTIPVSQGEVIDPAKMSLPVNPNLDNSIPGQTIGIASVQGLTGGTWRKAWENNYFDPTQHPGRYLVDDTGKVYVGSHTLLSYQRADYGYETDQIRLVWTSDDGTKTCTQTFTIPVKEAPEKIIYVGPGMKTKYGDASVKNAPPTAQGLDTLLEANKMCITFHPGVKYRFKCVQEPADQPEYYTDGTRDYGTRGGWIGPVAIDVMDLKRRPRGGGKSDNTGVNSGVTSGGKGFFLFSEGDAELVGWIVANVHGGGSNAGIEAIRKDGDTHGNTALIDVLIHDCDQGFENGPILGRIYLKRAVIRRCGGASVGAGLTHNIYCGSSDQVLMEDCFSGEALWGHLFKSRSRKTIVRNSRFLDTASTAAACPMDICDFGDVTIEGNFIQKGPMAGNPFVISLGAEDSDATVNFAQINNNIIVDGAMSSGGNYGATAAVMHFLIGSRNNGAISKVVGDGNQIWLDRFGQVSGEATDWIGGVGAAVPPGSTLLTNTKLLTVPPVMDLTDPTTGQPLEVFPGRPYRHAQILERRAPYPNFNGTLQAIDRLILTAPASAAAGTVVFKARAQTDIAYFGPVGTPEQFGPGTAYAWNMTGNNSWVYNHGTNPDPWVPVDTAGNALNFDLTTDPDGSYAVAYKGGLQPGGYYLRIVGAAASGKAVTDQRFFVQLT